MFFFKSFFVEVMQVLREKKYAKMNKNLREIDTEDQNSSCETEARSSGAVRSTQVTLKINLDFGNHVRERYATSLLHCRSVA